MRVRIQGEVVLSGSTIKEAGQDLMTVAERNSVKAAKALALEAYPRFGVQGVTVSSVYGPFRQGKCFSRQDLDGLMAQVFFFTALVDMVQSSPTQHRNLDDSKSPLDIL